MSWLYNLCAPVCVCIVGMQNSVSIRCWCFLWRARSEVKGRVGEGSEGDRVETAGLLPCTNNPPLSITAPVFLIFTQNLGPLFLFLNSVVSPTSLCNPVFLFPHFKIWSRCVKRFKTLLSKKLNQLQNCSFDTPYWKKIDITCANTPFLRMLLIIF